jgi:hypothetical protein
MPMTTRIRLRKKLIEVVLLLEADSVDDMQ